MPTQQTNKHTDTHTHAHMQAFVLLHMHTYLPVSLFPSVLPNGPPTTTAILSLAVEVHPSDRRSEIVDRCEVPCAEVCSPPWCISRLPDRLLKQYENKTMDSCSWTWALIGDYFISKTCISSLWNVSYQPMKVLSFSRVARAW